MKSFCRLKSIQYEFIDDFYKIDYIAPDVYLTYSSSSIFINSLSRKFNEKIIYRLDYYYMSIVNAFYNMKQSQVLLVIKEDTTNTNYVFTIQLDLDDLSWNFYRLINIFYLKKNSYSIGLLSNK